MKASEVVKQYQQGKRDFHRVNLTGQSFKGQDLSGADFSDADLRGTNFNGAILRGANFRGVKGGRPKRWSIILLRISWLILAINGFFLALIGYFGALVFDYDFLKQSIVVIGMTMVLILSIYKSLEARLGTLDEGEPLTLLEDLAFKVFIVVEVAVASVILLSFLKVIAIAIAFPEAYYSVLGYIALAIVVVLPYAVALSYVIAYANSLPNPGIVMIVIAIVIAGALGGALGGAFAFALTAPGVFWGRLAVKGDSGSSRMRRFAPVFTSTGGTSFYNADLTDADFTGAILKNTDLRAKSMIHTSWKDSIKLDNARVGKTLLAQAEVRELLVSGDGYQKSYLGANLRGANLVGANLSEANLKWADLSKATLAAANLDGANLTGATVMETDFTRACMTGACLDAWKINSKTKLEQVDCQYVYLLEKPTQGSDDRERHPSSGNFQVGEFTELIEKMSKTPKYQVDTDDWWFEQ